MSGARSGAGALAVMLLVLSARVAAAPIDLSQLCGTGDCVVSTNTTIGSASGALEVSGNFTVSPGVILEFRVPIQIKVAGNMVLAGTLGAPGNGGNGGNGGNPGQPGGAGGNAPGVVGATFDVQGSIRLDGSAIAVADGGSGGSGGMPGIGQTVGGAGGVGGAAGALTFNTCSFFTSVSSAQIRANGGPGGSGQAGALGGQGGAGGTITINSRQTIVSNAPMTARGGTGGNGGSGAGANGADGSITLRALGEVTVGSNTLDSGANTPSVNASQLLIPSLLFCVVPALPVPGLSAWAMLLLASLMVMFSIHRLRRRFGVRPHFRPRS